MMVPTTLPLSGALRDAAMVTISCGTIEGFY
jgi:hypothetical protein